jgi:hypothetical protein
LVFPSMLNFRATEAAKGRKDLSRFLVHLTRDDRECFPTGGKTAQENFKAIINERAIRAFRPHSLFNKEIAKLPEVVQKDFYVSCYTEVPLDQIHRLVGKIPGRKFCFEPYGLVFTRQFILEENGEPAVYVNGYGPAKKALNSVSALYDLAVSKEDGVSRRLYGILPYVTLMSEAYDFSWEREWRVKGRLEFSLRDIYCAILPEKGVDKISSKLRANNVACIFPSFTPEMIAEEIERYSQD